MELNKETTEKLNVLKENLPEGTAKDPAVRKADGNRIPNRAPKNINEALERFPAHIVNLVNIVKSNADIRRCTSLGILNFLSQKGAINAPKGFVEYYWTKFKVISGGLSTEYRYNEAFFINCLVAAFTSFSNQAQKTIRTFCSKELNENFKQDDNAVETAVAYVESVSEED